MLAFSNDYYGFIFRVTQSVELFCTYFRYSKNPENLEITAIRKYSQQLITNADRQDAKRELIFEQINSRSFNYGLDILVIALITTSL